MASEEDSPESSADSLQRPPTRWYVDPRAAGGRLLVSVIVGSLLTLLTPSTIAWRVRAMVGWDAAALLWVILGWMMVIRASAAQTRDHAATEDPGRHFVFVIAIGASLFSLFSSVDVLKQIRTLPAVHAQVWTGLALAAVALSWVVTHTAFTLRYAHLYYRTSGICGGLDFPGTEHPCDLDFAYFAFTIGMCFQVSDVVIKSSRIRRAVMVHAIISFIYNTTILALSLNLVTALLA